MANRKMEYSKVYGKELATLVKNGKVNNIKSR